jgi:fission 1 protein
VQNEIEMELPKESDVSQPLLREDFENLKQLYEKDPSVQTKFNYAWGLVRSHNRVEQHTGLRLLNGIFV